MFQSTTHSSETSASSSGAMSRGFIRRMDLTSLQLFTAVVETGSIGKAAQREHMAASAVSKRLSDLEAAVGAALLQRHSKGVSPTAAGASLAHHAHAVLRSLDRMHAELSEYADGVRGHVRVLANISAVVQFLPQDIGSFARSHEHIKVDLEERVSADVVRGVTEGAAELGICNAAHGVGSLQSRPYRRDQLAVICPPKHPFLANLKKKEQIAGVLPHKFAINFEATLDFDHVGLHETSSVALAARRAASNVQRALKLRVQVTSLDAMCRMIENGLGLGIMPIGAFELMPHVHTLCAIPLADAWAQRDVHLVACDFDALSAASRALVEHLLKTKP
jgi:DNA-binding transcriptional LysR family regulator